VLATIAWVGRYGADPGRPNSSAATPDHRCDHGGGHLRIVNRWDWPGRPHRIWLQPKAVVRQRGGGCNRLQLDQHLPPAPQNLHSARTRLPHGVPAPTVRPILYPRCVRSSSGANRHQETDQMSKESTAALWDAK
jgi:hypothetical protein